MLKIYPLSLAIPDEDAAENVACPPYDVISTEEAKSISAAADNSFVRVIRPEVDFPDLSPYDETIYRAAGSNLNDAVTAGHLRLHTQPEIYLYRQQQGEHRQTGVVCGYDVQQYRDGLIKKHELTRPDKEDDRVAHMKAVSAHPEPVLLSFCDQAGNVARMMEEDTQSEPIFDFVADDDVRHTGWKVHRADDYVTAFAEIESGYIADGHHRTAAAERVATDLAAADSDGQSAVEQVLSVWFPIEQLQILPYNRVVHNLNGLDVETVLDRLTKVGDIASDVGPVPDHRGQVCFYLKQTWHRLTIDPALIDQGNPIDSLDAALLQTHVLDAIFGIDNPRTHPNIGFVGGIRGTEELKRMVDDGEAAIAFSMHPTSIEELIRVSDEGLVMPPKSTWFEPKLRSGLFVHPF